MITLGAIHFSPAEIAVLLAMITAGAVALALPATLTLAWVGHRRGSLRPGWNALWYWFGGTALSVGTTALAADRGLSWWSVPIGWIPTLLLAALLNPRTTRRRTPPAS
jgi:hypothetical protein